MYFKQLIREDMGCASYIVGCPEAGVCAVVDPRIDMVDEIIALTMAKGMRIDAVIETHTHADHVSGHGELARRTGATIYVHELAGVAYEHRDVRDGDRLVFGDVKVRVMHTPGHRPEHIALAVADTSRSREPWLVLTGDSLFIGDVARPDLAVAGEEGANALYDSLFGRILELKDGVEVYPSHVAGSLCGRGMNMKTSSTIGYERGCNTAIRPRERAEFVRDINERLPKRPPNMAHIIERNREDYNRHTTRAVERMDAVACQKALAEDVLVLDTRTPDHFCASHIAGSLHVYLHGSAFPTRVGFVTPAGSPLLVVVESEQEWQEARRLLNAVGYEQVVGYMVGDEQGIHALQEAGVPMACVEQMSARELVRQLDEVTVLDVRDEGEWVEGHIEGAVNIPYNEVEERMGELNPEAMLAVLCAGGQRSVIACALLLRHGFRHVYNVVGGMGAWREERLAETF
jgi:hydroxyacylglutathione hydrolase